jgi:hypothetical protein
VPPKRAATSVCLAAAFALPATMAPTVPPNLEPTTLGHYLDVTRLRPNEAAAVGALRAQVFSGEVGRGVTLSRRSPPSTVRCRRTERRQTAIIASNYGEAAAIDFYDRSDGLPPALRGEISIFCGEHTALTATSSSISTAIRDVGENFASQSSGADCTG